MKVVLWEELLVRPRPGAATKLKKVEAIVSLFVRSFTLYFLLSAATTTQTSRCTIMEVRQIERGKCKRREMK